MGAGAFIMASYTQIPYVDIVAVSFVPALIYFLSVAFFVRIEAKRSGVQKITTSDESLGKVLLSGWHNLIPLAVLVTLLVQGFTPTYAAGLSILSVVVASWFSKDHKWAQEIIDALAQGQEHGDDCGLAGRHWLGDRTMIMHHRDWQYLLIGLINGWSQGDLLIMLVLIALASLVLGMGLPVTAAYIVLGTLSAPALYQLIAENQLLSLMSAGQLPEQAKA
ncbi:C4-dicarboxylate ABC transporter permease, partial [Vibrio sp. 03_296]